MKASLLVLSVIVAAWSVPRVCAYQDQDTRTIESFIARQAHRERGEEYPEARKVLEGDLDRDGVPDTVVLYTIESQGGSNNYVQYLAIFARRDGRLTPVAYTEVGGKSRRSVELTSVTDNIINLATLTYSPKDASCCPSIKGETHYVLVGRTLRERKQRPSDARHAGSR